MRSLLTKTTKLHFKELAPRRPEVGETGVYM